MVRQGNNKAKGDMIMKVFVLKEESDYHFDNDYIVDIFLVDDDFEINLNELSRKWKTTWKRGTWHNKYGHGKCKNRKPTIPFRDWMIDYLKLESVEWMEEVI